MITVKDMYIYPMKSARGIAVQHAEAGARGLHFDRRWMAIDAGGRFLSQRTHPVLATIDVSLDDTHIRLSVPGCGELFLPLVPASGLRRNVVVWDDTVNALETGREAHDWISDLLGEPCSIVYFPDDSQRIVDPLFAHNGEEIAFTDGFPVLVVSQPSLDSLNARLQDPVPMDRFRPNIVVEGCAPFAEDGWGAVCIGSAVCEIVKPCARCVITTIDQQTAKSGMEPLATLAQFRKHNGKIHFGQNALVTTPGSIAVGDEVSVSRTDRASDHPSPM